MILANYAILSSQEIFRNQELSQDKTLEKLSPHKNMVRSIWYTIAYWMSISTQIR